MGNRGGKESVAAVRRRVTIELQLSKKEGTDFSFDLVSDLIVLNNVSL